MAYYIRASDVFFPVSLSEAQTTMGNTKEKTPKTYSLRVTENALQNIDEITGYIAYIKHQPLNAIRVGNKIFETQWIFNDFIIWI